MQPQKRREDTPRLEYTSLYIKLYMKLIMNDSPSLSLTD